MVKFYRSEEPVENPDPSSSTTTGPTTDNAGNKSGKKRSEDDANLDDNEQEIGDTSDTNIMDPISSAPAQAPPVEESEPTKDARATGNMQSDTGKEKANTPPTAPIQANTVTLSREEWGQVMSMMATQSNKIDIMEAQMDQMANNAASDTIPKSRAESDRKLRSVCPNLPDTLKEKSTKGNPIALQDFKKVLRVNAGAPNLHNVLTQDENGSLSSKDGKEVFKSFPDLFATWTANLAMTLLHSPEFLTYESIADHLKYQAMLCEYSKIIYPEEVANLDKTHRTAIGQYLPHSRLSDIDAAKLAVVVGSSTFNQSLSSCKICNCESAFCVCEKKTSPKITPRPPNPRSPPAKNNTCNDFNRNGTCTRGAACTYKHECNKKGCTDPTTHHGAAHAAHKKTP